MPRHIRRTRNNPGFTGLLIACLAVAILSASAQGEPRVRFSTTQGEFTIDLTPQVAPATVENFLNYVSRGDYTDMFFHRSAPGFVLQGGGFDWPSDEAGPGNIPTDPPVRNEFNVSNTRATVAMAKQDGDPNSATSQWFVNLADNGGNLDNQNGGFTVFGTVDTAGMQVVDGIAGLERVNAGGAFTNLPVRNYSGGTVFRENVVLVLSAEELPSNSIAPGAAILPSGRAVTVNSTATAFATLLNASDTPIERCRFRPTSDLPINFFYRQTNPATNAAFGPNDPIVDVAANTAATFIFSITPTASFSSTSIGFRFTCGTTPDAPTVTGVNTFDLAASDSPLADVIALAATLGNNGIVDLPASVGAGAFSVATINLGSTESIEVSAQSTGGLSGLELFVCPTDAATGQCQSDPAASVTQPMATNETATFAVFVNGADIPFNPAANRVFVRFANAAGAARGATSVAVRSTSD